MMDDVRHEITDAHGVEREDGDASRAGFLIDRLGRMQHQVVNNLTLDREVDEAIRIIETLQFTEEYGEVCPAGWHKGDRAMKTDSAAVAVYLREHAESL